MNNDEIKTWLPPQEFELLKELNRIIGLVFNGYLWRELSEFDLNLRNYFSEKAVANNVSSLDKDIKISEIDKI